MKLFKHLGRFYVPVVLVLVMFASMFAVSCLCGKGKPETAIDLFDGKTLDGWDFFLVNPKLKMSDVWTVEDGLLVCKGKPMGYLATKKDYKDYTVIP